MNIFVRDRETGHRRSSSAGHRPAGAAANGDSANPAISYGGARYVAFESQADNLSDTDNDAVTNVFLHDTSTAARSW